MNSAVSSTLLYVQLPPIAEVGKTPPYTRVLTLWPGNHFDALACRLDLLDIENPSQPYEALSYVWGVEQSSSPLLCDNGHLKITLNLDQALRALRYTNHPRRLWVDAVCINQGDLAERARQVTYMRLVYKHASRTVVWLGLANVDTEKAFRFMRELNELFGELSPSQLAARFQNNPQSLSPDETDILTFITAAFEFREDEVQALHRVLDGNYFQRVWCLQEVAASSSCIGKSGHLEIDFNYILALIAFVVDRRGVDPNPSTLNIWRVIEMKKLRDNGMSPNVPEDAVASILNLLMGIRNFKSTDPRDRIFALLGISNEGLEPSIGREIPNRDSSLGAVVRGIEWLATKMNSLGPGIDVLRPPELTPNYDKSTRETYRDFTRYCVRRHPRILEVLSHVQHHSDPAPGYPSWVPKFDEHRIASFFTSQLFLAGIPATGHYRYFAEVHDNPLRPDNPFGKGVQQPDLLRLNGFRVDEIEKVSDIPLLDTNHLLNPENVWQQLFNGPIIGNYHQSYPYSREALNIAFLMTLICGGVTMLTGGMLYGTVSPSENRFVALEQAECIGKADLLAWARTIPHFGETSYQDVVQKARQSLLTGDGTRFLQIVANLCWNRRVYRTRAGIIGLGPRITRPGDSVVVLFGGRHPFVIRSTGGAEHLLIGDTYVRHTSIMHGQEAVLVKSPQGEHRIETFILR